MANIDTIGENYYKPLLRAEIAGDVLFWLISILSIIALFVDKVSYPLAFDVVQIALIVGVILFFVQGQVQKLYLFPRAEDKRRQQLLSNSFGVALTHEETVGYYNNDQTDPIKRLAASVMESAFFTNAITLMMLPAERAKTFGYIMVYLVAVLNRSSDLAFLAIAAQALFGGEIVARWLRLEWLQFRSEQAFNNFNRLFVARPAFTKAVPQSEALDLFSFYESTKSTAAMLLSQKVFDQHNPRLTQEWERIRGNLGI
ncbi:hypothetical protein [Rhodomicrobium lacus]|uniref:hypothetical protein n=1 Tax=Rhodomicrobium lacus TaxID=2498452 RepID=UPI0026E47825|nr:hypothetical protein [Rhodomicrobium lacus]WKW50422.1 hypothetical protein QMO75_14215 [Rhodomicrobium lacus]